MRAAAVALAALAAAAGGAAPLRDAFERAVRRRENAETGAGGGGNVFWGVGSSRPAESPRLHQPLELRCGRGESAAAACKPPFRLPGGFEVDLVSRSGLKAQNEDNVFFYVYEKRGGGAGEGAGGGAASVAGAPGFPADAAAAAAVGIFAVADGHGQLGARASRAALAAVQRAVAALFRPARPLPAPARALEAVFSAADDAVLAAAGGYGGSTLTVALWAGGRLWLAAAGDSPAYLMSHPRRTLIPVGEVCGSENRAENEKLWRSMECFFGGKPVRVPQEEAVVFAWQGAAAGGATPAGGTAPAAPPDGGSGSAAPLAAAGAPAAAVAAAGAASAFCRGGAPPAELPTISGASVPPSCLPGSGQLRYHFRRRDAQSPHLAVMRVGVLSPATSLGDNPPGGGVVTSASFVRSQPALREIAAPGEEEELLLASDGFSNSLQWAGRAALPEIATCDAAGGLETGSAAPAASGRNSDSLSAPPACLPDVSLHFQNLQRGRYDNLTFPPLPFLSALETFEDFVERHALEYAFSLLARQGRAGSLEKTYDVIRASEMALNSPWFDDFTLMRIRRVGPLGVN